MRKNHRFSKSNRFPSNSKLQPNNPNLAIPTHSTRPGLIDESLIGGSQQPQQFRMLSQQSTHDPMPHTYDDEEDEFDAFDLELLAQTEAPAMTMPRGNSGFPVSTPLQGSCQSNTGHDNAPQHISRFFHPSSSTTPLRGQGSRSSEIGSMTPSSPLMRKAGPLEQGYLETARKYYQPDTMQSFPQPFSSHQSSEAATRPKVPFLNIPPSIRGILLVSVNDLPESHRSLFRFPLFNAIQSKCFHAVYNTSDNLVLSAPTGSGKTVVMELAICRLLNTLKDERFKVVYQAPTKALCAERFRDWNQKLSALDVKCAECTGDTDYTQLRSVQNSQVIITTPEKWDSMTRKWKDHIRLMQLIKLFLIDEVHILKETRGATLEAVVSRMKTIGSNVRFVALSATVPNSDDVATWLGKDATNQHVPAHREHFGEEFRPVKLQKFVYGYQSTANDFAFDKICASKLPEVLGMHSSQKPIMIFCCTRNSTVATAKELVSLWTRTNPPARLWKGPSKPTITAGVAFHHAGLGPADRHTVEKGFLGGDINVICCTSTLAVGVNLPCHLVIIKNTVGWQEGGCKEYSDLEMMQMLGRAGRPQFDDSATAVILTRKERVAHYEKLVSGSESLESCLHLNLIEHLNAEIGLGNVSDVDSAAKWLAGTFLFIRLRRNPTHYKLKEDANQDDEDEMLQRICEKDIKLLQENGLVESDALRSTQFGEAMARYYIRFETMKTLLSLKPQATISQTLTAISQAEEFRELRLKAGEKSLYREINNDPGIRYPIKVDIALPCHKITLLLQSELGATEFPDTDQLQKHKFPFQQDKNQVFAHVNRLIRCVIDCHIARGDSVAIQNALSLARSFGAKVWDHSPLQMKQIEQVGVVTVRRLATAGITSIEALESTEANRIEMILSKNPPLWEQAPRTTQGVSEVEGFCEDYGQGLISSETKIGAVKIRFKVDMAFMNDKVPVFFQRRPVYVCSLAETSDGRMIDFRRISASKLQEGLQTLLSAELKSPDQFIVCHVMCDDIAGTWRQAEIRPDVPSHFFPYKRDENARGPGKDISRHNSHNRDVSIRSNRVKDDFEGDDLELDDFLAASQSPEKAKKLIEPSSCQRDSADWMFIDNTPTPSPPHPARKSHGWTAINDNWPTNTNMGSVQLDDEENENEPIRLPTGRCKHFCCRDGLEKPPKRSRKQAAIPNQKSAGLSQLTLSASMSKKDSTSRLREQEQDAENALLGRKSEKKRMSGLPASSECGGININHRPETMSSDYDDDIFFDDLPSRSLLMGKVGSSVVKPNANAQERNETTGSAVGTWEMGEVRSTAKATAPQVGIAVPKSPAKPQDDLDFFDVWDDLTSEPETFKDPKEPEASKDVVALNPSEANGSRKPKRKASKMDVVEGQLFQHEKRVKPASSMDATTPEESTQVERKAMKVSAEWDDIDPLLLDEFKDIVNFF
ncbi:hypothetical protein N7510_009290 [Penicillium lagena]|uniref:uncharacterized protein n=1 Tax=Penicillium lagena TaxID=94218 RepID=UPI002540E070|nr:uncharacterized protein N7510_009290 [Penicillium lagena]KAJ5606509.1 hypothetical protein N7510_009290 [Penicillium lagena]